MTRRLLLPLVALTVVWVALWERLSWANVISGAVVALVLLRLFPVAHRSGLGAPRPLPTLRFVGHFLARLVEASAIVAWEVLTPNNERINEAVVAVPLTSRTDGLVTVVANAVSLTPGTLVIEVDLEPTTTLYVHVLHLRSIEEVRASVHRLERYALAAFGSPTGAPG